jgi:2-dehydro-3-deoxy-D-arabinonate dehydratase
MERQVRQLLRDDEAPELDWSRVLYLTRHESTDGPRWALDGRLLADEFTLSGLLRLPAADMPGFLRAMAGTGAPAGALLAPLESNGEVWAAGVTYLRSREAREAESTVKDVYSKVYDAERPELFCKAQGWRVAGHGMPIRIRRDSRWNVPEPELTLVVNTRGEIVGFCAGNDVSSRDIEGENPLYLPQAKIYDGSCALGPGISLCEAGTLRDLPIDLVVLRAGRPIFTGATRSSQIKRPLQELVDYLRKELSFPDGVFLMTGTGVVPPDDFSLEPGDRVRVTIGELTLENPVER